MAAENGCLCECRDKKDLSMENFMMAASVVVPIFIYMAVGMLVRKLGFLSADHFRALNNVLFHVFLPITLFCNIYSAESLASLKPALFAGVFLGLVAEFVILRLIVPGFVKEQKDMTAMVQGMYRSNFILFGTQIAAGLCNAEGAAAIAALSAVVVPTQNVLAVILFETGRGEKIGIGKLIADIFKNPLVDAGLIGVVFLGFQIPIPSLIAIPLERMGSMATPLALITLGGMLSFGSIAKHKLYLTAATIARLVLIPLLAVLVAVALGARGNTLVAVMAVFASPTAVASVPMAQNMGGNEELAGEIVAVSSLFSLLSLFLFSYILLGLGLF